MGQLPIFEVLFLKIGTRLLLEKSTTEKKKHCKFLVSLRTKTQQLLSLPLLVTNDAADKFEKKYSLLVNRCTYYIVSDK